MSIDTRKYVNISSGSIGASGGTSGGFPPPPAGYAYFVDSQGNYFVDSLGNYLVVRIL